MECERQIFCHFGSFFGLSHNYRLPKIKIWKKNKKLLEILFKSVITTIFPSDYFKENKMKKKILKKIQNSLFWDPFGPNTSKSEISANIRLSVLRC